jgi:hypothetical protein
MGFFQEAHLDGGSTIHPLGEDSWVDGEERQHHDARRSQSLARLGHCHIFVTAGMLWLGLATYASAQWPHQSQLGVWRIHTDFPMDRYRPMLGELPQIRKEVLTRLNLRASEESIDVYLFSNQAVYHAYMKQYFPGVVPRRAMFIKADGPGNVFAYVSPELETDLRHECTHAVLHTALPMVPLWLDEGLAEYFEVPVQERSLDNPHMAAVQRGLLWKRPPSLERLEAIQDLSQMGPVEYEEAWAWVHFLLHGPPTVQSCLANYLSAIERQTPPIPLGEQLKQVNEKPSREFVNHFRRWRR